MRWGSSRASCAAWWGFSFRQRGAIDEIPESHLETVEYRESAIDRVGALAHAGKLSRLLMHWKYAGQDVRNAVLEELLIKARRRFGIGPGAVDHPVLVKTCKQAMREYHSPQCASCGGARELVVANLRITCSDCSGVGVRRYSDQVRAEAIGVAMEAYKSIWEARLTAVNQILGARDSLAVLAVKNQLRTENEGDKILTAG